MSTLLAQVLSLAWLLTFTKSFASIVSRVVSLLTTRQTSDTNDSANVKSHVSERNLSWQGIRASVNKKLEW